ncbi:MAG: hypothetical protein Q4A21_00590 [bacterium]|nr:hypothetical protein [bacterium]
MKIRINNAFNRQLLPQIGIFFLPKNIQTKKQNKAISALVLENMDKLPFFTEKEILDYKNSAKTIKFWHGTGEFEYRNREIKPIFKNILKHGLKVQQDDYLVIYSEKLRMKSISFVEDRTIARCYADIHNYGKPDFRFGDSIFWIVRHYTKMYILAYTTHSLRSLFNIMKWRRLNNIGSDKSWSGKVNKAARNTWESFEKYSDIEGNFPVILGVKRLERTARLPKIFSDTETRSLENVSFKDISHIEIPLNLMKDLSPKIKKANPDIKIFPIELGELVLFQKHKQ